MSFFKDPETVNFIKSVQKEVSFGLTPYEAFFVYSTAKTQSILEGEMAEVGVHQGGSAKLICKAKGNRKLHLFDTFEGLPPVEDIDRTFEDIKCLDTHDFSNTDLDSVRKHLSSFENVYFYKGRFPDTSEPVKNSTFSFVHLDVDLYESTLDCLKFFYPRLIQGGIIISHDYSTLSGVRKAFDDFFLDKKKPVFEIMEKHCMVIKY